MGGGFWTDEYYVAMVRERGNWKTVEEYMLSQGKPKEELRQLELDTLWFGGCPTIRTEFIIIAVKEINLQRGGIKAGIH